MEVEFSRQVLEKFSCIKFYENNFHWEPCCSLRTDRRTDMTKSVVAFNNFAKAPKDFTFCPHSVFVCFCIDLRTNSCYFPIQHQAIGFYNRVGECLLRGTGWVFKYNQASICL